MGLGLFALWYFVCFAFVRVGFLWVVADSWVFGFDLLDFGVFYLFCMFIVCCCLILWVVVIGDW